MQWAQNFYKKINYIEASCFLEGKSNIVYIFPITFIDYFLFILENLYATMMNGLFMILRYIITFSIYMGPLPDWTWRTRLSLPSPLKFLSLLSAGPPQDMQTIWLLTKLRFTSYTIYFHLSSFRWRGRKLSYLYLDDGKYYFKKSSNEYIG